MAVDQHHKTGAVCPFCEAASAVHIRVAHKLKRVGGYHFTLGLRRRSLLRSLLRALRGAALRLLRGVRHFSVRLSRFLFIENSVRVKIVFFAADLQPAGLHCAARRQVIRLAADLKPAGLHRSARRQIILLSAVCHPAGLHLSVCRQIIPEPLDLHPAGLHRSICSQVVPLSAVLDPAGLHLPARRQIVPLSVVFHPAGLHDPVFVEEIPFSGIFDPSGDRPAAADVIPVSVLVIPSVLQIAEFTRPVGVRDAFRDGPDLRAPRSGHRSGRLYRQRSRCHDQDHSNNCRKFSLHRI